MITALAWRNIWRQPIRTALSMLGMALTSALLVFMLSFQFGSYDIMKSSVLRISQGFGQFQAKGYKADPETAKTIKNAPALRADLAKIPGVTASSSRSVAFVLLANGERSFAAAVVGVDMKDDAKISKLSSMVKQGRPLNATDTNAIVLGEGLARNLRLKLGDTVTMLGSGLDGSVAADALKLVGIFKSGVPELDRQVAHVPLARFDEAFGMNGQVNIVAITGNRLNDIVNDGRKLNALADKYGLAYLDWGALAPGIKQAITLDMSTAFIMYLTLVVVVVFIILNTLYMSVLERTHEFGILLAIGMKPAQIGKMVWAEMIFLSLVGNGIGILLGIAITLYFQKYGIVFKGMDAIYAQWGLPARFYPMLSTFSTFIGPSAIVISIVVLGVIPYRRVLGLEPVEAMSS
ncbi:MAG: ABC transporter permease [Alphaproteobacteria bacterium]|nr:ABC transporter permease [Alphaproteobacteria bacterium]